VGAEEAEAGHLVREIWGRCRGDVGEMWGRYRGDMGAEEAEAGHLEADGLRDHARGQVRLARGRGRGRVRVRGEGEVEG